jgi:predicted metal-dependent phosphoesterase TrpH
VNLLRSEGNPWDAGCAGKPWLRGNFHCHTTESDGRLSPQETIDWFSGAGYQLLALTDHERVTETDHLDARGLCLIRATEVSAAGGEMGDSFHLVALGLPLSINTAALPAKNTVVAEYAPWLREQGAQVYIAHPHWSGLTVADLVAVAADGIEIYNGGTVLDSQKGLALTHFDEGLARGARWWGIAVDDTHWHTIDRALGWVMVRAQEQTQASVMEAMARGQFYSSSGPEIRQVKLSAGPDGALTVDVETSPCAAIYVLSYGSRNIVAFDREAAARGAGEATITHATVVVKRIGPGGYFRLQCVDWQMRAAWSNPLYPG